MSGIIALENPPPVDLENIKTQQCFDSIQLNDEQISDFLEADEENFITALLNPTDNTYIYIVVIL
jgi:hypothetical protein